SLADTVKMYVTQLKALDRSTRQQIEENNRQLQEGVYRAINDPQHPTTLPGPQQAPPGQALDFAALDSAVDQLTRAAQHYQQAVATHNGTVSANAAKQVNALLIQSERKLLLDSGLQNRPWYRHQIYAPGFYTGYGVKTIPAVRESIEQKQWRQAEEQILRVGKVLENAGEQIQGAAIALEKVAQ